MTSMNEMHRDALYDKQMPLDCDTDMKVNIAKWDKVVIPLYEFIHTYRNDPAFKVCNELET